MLFGNIIFSGEACAVLKEYNKAQPACERHILFVYSLTVDIAFYILRNPVCGVISEESSFATHGANILRCNLNNSSDKLVWVSGIRRFEIANLFEEIVLITQEGAVSAFNVAGCVSGGIPDRNRQKISTYIPLNKRSILNYNISDNSYEICYWPHRQFNQLTYSIMREGLIKNLHLLGVDNPSISIDARKSIWFKGAPLLSELIELAKNIDSAFPILNKQINMYGNMYTKLQDDFSFLDLVQMLIDYFSVFILFHDTYEDILVEADMFFKIYLEKPIVYKIMNLLMCCKLDEWMLDNNIILEKRKNLLSNEDIVPLPNFSIFSDIDYCIKRFFEFLFNFDFGNLVDLHKNKIEFYIKFFVAKEWKFVMNKILFTRFSQRMCKQFPNSSFTELATKNINEILSLTKDFA